MAISRETAVRFMTLLKVSEKQDAARKLRIDTSSIDKMGHNLGWSKAFLQMVEQVDKLPELDHYMSQILDGDLACTCQRYPTHCANDCPQHGLEDDAVDERDADEHWPQPNSQSELRDFIEAMNDPGYVFSPDDPQHLLRILDAEGTTGFMCKVDFEDELGNADGGNAVYPSEANLRAHRKCVDQCGIVRVRVVLDKVFQEDTYSEFGED